MGACVRSFWDHRFMYVRRKVRESVKNLGGVVL